MMDLALSSSRSQMARLLSLIQNHLFDAINTLVLLGFGLLLRDVRRYGLILLLKKSFI
jgi:hypothetical protein